MQKLKPILFYLLLFLVSLALSSMALGYDYDLWARLIAGMAVVQTGQILREDFLSYTPTHEWIDHEWGSSVVFYLTQHHFGAYGIIFLQAILTFLIFVFIYKTIEIHIIKGVSRYNIIFYILGFLVFMNHFQLPIRCQMFTFMFFAMFLYILELARVKNINKSLFLLPLLIIIWNNMHGGVVAGIGLLVIYIVGEAWNKKPFKKYFYVLCAALPLMLINPYGFEYIKFLLMANTMKRQDIIEWQGLFSNVYLFGFIKFKVFALFIILIEAIKVFKTKFDYKNLDKTKFLLLVITLILAVQHVKLVSFFVISGLIFAYNDFYKLIEFIKFPKWKNKFIYIVVLMASLVVVNVWGLNVARVSPEFPVYETEFVKINNLDGKILTNFGLGSYVAYKLYPDNLIYMDGRYEEVYDEELVFLLKKFMLVTHGWEEVLEKYPPDVMILENCYPIIEKLKTTDGWNLAYNGNNFTVFVSDKIKKEKYLQPSKDYYYYVDKYFDTKIDFRKKNK